MNGKTLPLIIDQINITEIKILENELELNLFKPLQFLMDSASPNFSNINKNHKGVSFDKIQQIQIYLHILSSRKTQHHQGNINYNFYSYFLEKTYFFNINEPEITNITSILLNANNNKSRNNNIIDIISKRVSLECIEQSINSTSLLNSEKIKFKSFINNHINNHSFNLQNLFRTEFIHTQLITNRINAGQHSKKHIAKQFITSLKKIFEKNKIKIKVLKTKPRISENREYNDFKSKFYIKKKDLIQPVKNILINELFKISNNSIDQLIFNIKQAKIDIQEKFLNFSRNSKDQPKEAAKYWIKILQKENIVGNQTQTILRKFNNSYRSCCPCFSYSLFKSKNNKEAPTHENSAMLL